MGKCYVCNGKGSLKHLERDICKKCFLRNVEKRVKRSLGRRRFKKGDKILVIGEVEKVLLEKAVGGLPVKITFRKKLVKVKEFDWVVVGKTMDEVDEKFLEELFEGKLELGEGKRKVFNILESLTDDEIKQYAKLKGIKFEKSEREGLLDEFKELKYNLYKNIKELRNF